MFPTVVQILGLKMQSMVRHIDGSRSCSRAATHQLTHRHCHKPGMPTCLDREIRNMSHVITIVIPSTAS